jgi:hypothetical protein
MEAMQRNRGSVPLEKEKSGKEGNGESFGKTDGLDD